MGLLGLTATGICAMVGAAVNVIPFMIQRQVPGIGPNVLPAYLLGAVPAVLAGLAYAMLASAMPRAGGSYVYASRALSPYLGFVASFSQWFSLCGGDGRGVVPDHAVPARHRGGAAVERRGGDARARPVRGWPSRWRCCGRPPALNLLGIKAYERLMVPLMFLTFALGVGGDRRRVQLRPRRLRCRRSQARGDVALPRGRRRGRAAAVVRTLLPASVLLFASFIGFDSIAQAGGEARRPGRDLPLAIFIAVGVGRRCSTSCSPRPSTTPRRGPTWPPRRSAAT